MKCLDCGEKMEREDGAILKYESPNATYSCPSCGGEWVWRRGKKMRQIGRSVIGVDVLINRPIRTGADDYDDFYEEPPLRHSGNYE